MKVVPVEQVELTLPELAALARTGPIILTRKGKPLASIKYLSGSDWESISLANNPRFLALIEEARRSYQEEGGVGIDNLRKELGLKAKPRQPRRKKRS